MQDQPMKLISKKDMFFKTIKTTKVAYLKSPYNRKQKIYSTDTYNTINHSTIQNISKEKNQDIQKKCLQPFQYHQLPVT